MQSEIIDDDEAARYLDEQDRIHGVNTITVDGIIYQ